MRSLQCVVSITVLASAMMFAQSQEKTNPQPVKPDQADRPAGQAAPPAKTQAESPSASTGAANTRTFTGTIVNATCSQASSLMRSGSFADQSAPAASKSTTAGPKETQAAGTKDTQASSTSTNKENKSVYDMQRDVMRHCPATSSVTAFAVLTDDGNFYKLDDAGNTQVMSQAGGSDSDKHKKGLKNMRVTVTGTVQGESLKVQSLTKTDKPFGSA